MKKPSKNHPWKLGLSGPVSYGSRRGSTRGYYRPPEESSPVKTLSPSEIEELGLDLVVPVKEIITSPLAGIGSDTDFLQRLL